jgi:hypothetical protein
VSVVIGLRVGSWTGGCCVGAFACGVGRFDGAREVGPVTWAIVGRWTGDCVGGSRVGATGLGVGFGIGCSVGGGDGTVTSSRKST